MNDVLPPPPPPPAWPNPLPEPPVDPDRSGVRPALVLGSITFVLFLFVVWLMPDPGCRAGFCGAANTLLLVTLLGQPVVATVVASVRAGRASLRVSIGARAVIAASISLGLVGGLLLGEVLRGISSASVTLLLTVPLAAMLLWPVPFVVATVTSWIIEGRATMVRRRTPLPRRGDT